MVGCSGIGIGKARTRVKAIVAGQVAGH